MQLLSPKEEGREISSLFVNETVELDETESMEGDKDDVSARLQNAVALGMIMVTNLRM